MGGYDSKEVPQSAPLSGVPSSLAPFLNVLSAEEEKENRVRGKRDCISLPQVCLPDGAVVLASGQSHADQTPGALLMEVCNQNIPMSTGAGAASKWFQMVHKESEAVWKKQPGLEDAVAWLEYRPSRPVRILAYTLTAADDRPGRDPQSWCLEGAVDEQGDSWEVLDDRSDIKFEERYTSMRFELQYAVTAPLLKLRFRFLANAGEGDGSMQLKSISFEQATTVRMIDVELAADTMEKSKISFCNMTGEHVNTVSVHDLDTMKPGALFEIAAKQENVPVETLKLLYKGEVVASDDDRFLADIFKDEPASGD